MGHRGLDAAVADPALTLVLNVRLLDFHTVTAT